MAQVSHVKVVITGKKGWAAQSMQERNNLVAIFHPHSSDFTTDAPKMDFPRSQQLALCNDNVLIKDSHAARCCFSAFSIKALLASSIASAMAS